MQKKWLATTIKNKITQEKRLSATWLLYKDATGGFTRIRRNCHTFEQQWNFSFPNMKNSQVHSNQEPDARFGVSQNSLVTEASQNGKFD